jgi:hypothetical protein
MTQAISRLYSSHENAEAAAAELKKDGFSDVHVVGPAGDEADDAVEASVMAAGVPKAHAKAYADGLRRGETLVTVFAPFGYATAAAGILAGFSPTETELPDAGYEVREVDEATPLSSWLGWRVLLHNPAPLSSWLGWRTLSADQGPTKRTPVLPDDPAPLSKRLGWSVLSPDAAPLSKRFGWSVLSPDPAPLSKRFGWSVLSNEPAPLSKRLGWSVLSDNPAPLSTRLGWRLLCNDPMPLTNWYRRMRAGSNTPKP